MKVLKILGIVAAVIVLLIIAATVVAKIIFTKEKILSILIPKIEQTIHREVSVKDASLSIFPSVSVDLDSLVIKNPIGYQQENLISLEKFSVKLKLLPLLRKRIELGKLVLLKPDIYLEKTGQKQSNYQDFLQPDREKKIIPFTFDRLEIKEARIVFYNRPKESSMVIKDLNQEGKLELIQDRILVTEGKLSIGNIQLKRSGGVLSYPLELEYKASYDLIFDSLRVDEAAIKFAQIQIQAKGRIEDLTRQPVLSLKLQAKDLALKEFLALLPESQTKLAQDWKSSSRVGLKINGVWDFKQGMLPSQLDGEIFVKEIELTVKENLPKVTIPLLTAKLSEKNVTVTTSQAKIGDTPLQFRAVIENPQEWSLSGEVNSKLDLALLPQLVQMPAGTQLSGDLELNTSFYGKLKNLPGLNLAGTYNFNQVSINSATLAQPLTDLNARLRLTSGDLLLENLSARQGKSNFALEGSCQGLVPYLLSKNEQKQEHRPTLNFSFTSTHLNLDEILPATDTVAGSASDSTLPNAFYLGLAQFMNFEGKLKLDTAIFREVELTDFRADFSLINGLIKLTNVSSKVYSGTATGEAICDLSDPENIRFEMKIKSKGMEANNFLSRFSQVKNHLYGRLNFEGAFAGEGKSLPQIQNSLAGDGQVSLSDGKLIKWDFASRLAGFLNFKQLEEEPIRELQHKFVVKGARLHFEEFFAASKNADWKLAGSIGLLDNTLDYSVNILLSPEISNQVTILGEQANFLKDDKGRLLVPLKIGGSASSPQFSIDFSLVSQKLQNQLKQNLQEKKSEVKEGLLKQGKDVLEELLKKKKKDG